MKMSYSLNGKKISHSEYLMPWKVMRRWIESRILDAIEDGKEIQIFNTTVGPLVITIAD